MTEAGEFGERAEKIYRVYDDCTNALAFQKYNSAGLGGYRRWNMRIDIVLAAIAPSVAGSWAIWQSGIGVYVWPVIAAAGGLLAIVKPILQLPRRIEQYSKARTGYSDLYYDLLRLATKISAARHITEAEWNEYVAATERFQKLAAADDDPRPEKKLFNECLEEAKREIKGKRFWQPPEDATDAKMME